MEILVADLQPLHAEYQHTQILEYKVFEGNLWGGLIAKKGFLWLRRRHQALQNWTLTTLNPLTISHPFSKCSLGWPACVRFNKDGWVLQCEPETSFILVSPIQWNPPPCSWSWRWQFYQKGDTEPSRSIVHLLNHAEPHVQTPPKNCPPVTSLPPISNCKMGPLGPSPCQWCHRTPLHIQRHEHDSCRPHCFYDDEYWTCWRPSRVRHSFMSRTRTW